MNLKLLVLISSILIATITSLVLLFYLSDLPNKNENGFIRKWHTENPSLVSEIKIKVPLQKICGATESHLYFTVPNPQGIIMFDKKLTKQDTLLYGIPVSRKTEGVSNTYVDSPNVYFFANNIPAFFHGRFWDTNVDSTTLSTSVFTRSARISTSSVVVRSLTTDQEKQIFQKVDSHSGLVIKENEIVSEQGLGGFQSDGTFLFDHISNRLFYVLFYQNLFYCIDTNLNVIYKAHTIDTTNTNSVTVERVKLKKEDRLMPTSPRVTVNQESCIGGNYLFVLSGLKADNEPHARFNKSSVIDLYHLNNGKYDKSIYIVNPTEDKIKSMFVQNNLLVLLYKKYIRTYNLLL